MNKGYLKGVRIIVFVGLVIVFMHQGIAVCAAEESIEYLKEELLRTTDPKEAIEICFQILEIDHMLMEVKNQVFDAARVANEKGEYERAFQLSERYLNIPSGYKHNDFMGQKIKALEGMGLFSLAIETALPLVAHDADHYYYTDGRINEIYFNSLYKDSKEDTIPPPWVKILSPGNPTIAVQAETPTEYVNSRMGVGGREASMLLRAAPGYLFSRIDFWADVDVKKNQDRLSDFVYVSVYNPVGGYYEEEGLHSKGTGRQKIKNSLSLREPWPTVIVRLFGPNVVKDIYGWNISAEFVPGSAAEAIEPYVNKKQEEKQQKKEEPRISLRGSPGGVEFLLDSELIKSDFGPRAVSPGRHTVVFNHSSFGRRQVEFSVQPAEHIDVRAAMENGWCSYTVSGIPDAIEEATLAPLADGGYLLIGSRKHNLQRDLCSWYSSDLIDWESLGRLGISFLGSNTSPSICTSKEGEVFLFWFVDKEMLCCSSSMDGRTWSTPSFLPEYTSNRRFKTRVSVTLGDEDMFYVACNDMWTRGRPGSWQPWQSYDIESVPSNNMRSTEIIRRESGQYIMVYESGDYKTERSRMLEGDPVLVTSSTDGVHWTSPIEVDIGEYPQLYESDGNIWIMMRGRKCSSVYYSKTGQRWFGPSPLIPITVTFSDIVNIGQGRYAAVSGETPVSIIVGYDFPKSIARLENYYNWEYSDNNSLSKHFPYRRLANGSVFPLKKPLAKVSRSFLDERRFINVGATGEHRGNLWVAIDGKGVFCVSPESKVVSEYITGSCLESDVFTALEVDDECIWIGTPAGLEMYDRTGGQSEIIKQDISVSYLVKGLGYLWGLSDGKVFRIDQESTLSFLPIWPKEGKPQKIKMLWIEDDTLWFVTRDLLWKYSISTTSIKEFFDFRTLSKFKHDNGYCMDKEFFWVSSGNRLFRISKANADFHNIVVNTGCRSSRESYFHYSLRVSCDDKYIYLGNGDWRGEKNRLDIADGQVDYW